MPNTYAQITRSLKPHCQPWHAPPTRVQIVWRTLFFVRNKASNKEPAVLSTIEIMLHSLLLSCLLASTSALLRPAPPKTTSRRALLAGTLAVAAAGPAPALAISTIATAADVVQVVQSYQTLGLSLEQWSVETALMQIGRPTQLQRAVDQLPELLPEQLLDSVNAVRTQCQRQ